MKLDQQHDEDGLVVLTSFDVAVRRSLRACHDVVGAALRQVSGLKRRSVRRASARLRSNRRSAHGRCLRDGKLETIGQGTEEVCRRQKVGKFVLRQS